MINNKDYQGTYNLLNTTFRNNTWNTLDFPLFCYNAIDISNFMSSCNLIINVTVLFCSFPSMSWYDIYIKENYEWKPVKRIGKYSANLLAYSSGTAGELKFNLDWSFIYIFILTYY